MSNPRLPEDASIVGALLVGRDATLRVGAACRRTVVDIRRRHSRWADVVVGRSPVDCLSTGHLIAFAALGVQARRANTRAAGTALGCRADVAAFTELPQR